MMMNTLSAVPIIIFATLAMAGAVCAFSLSGSSRSMLSAPRSPLGTRCAATIAGDSKWCPQSSSRANSPHLDRSRHLESPLFARRRRGSSADEENDLYDDDYIDGLINEKFDDDFDDDEFIIDAEVEESSVAGADKDDDREYEYARVGRRRGRGADRYEGGGSRGDGDGDAPSSSSRREQRRQRSYDEDDVDQYDGYDAEFDEEDDDYEEDYEEDYDSDDDEDDFEEGILIPNPILDSVDPEGASERIGELFEDPKFFRDMAVVAFVVWVVYFLTFDPIDLIPWDIMKPEDFPLESLYEK